MLIESGGITVDGFYIPPFTLKKGELLSVVLGNGTHFETVEKGLRAVFTGVVEHPEIQVHQPFTFVDSAEARRLKKWFRSATVGEYLENMKVAEPQQIIRQVQRAARYYEQYVNASVKMNELEGTPLKMIVLLATLSQTGYVLFDLTEVVPLGTQAICRMVKTYVKNKGAAILIDHVQTPLEYCTKMVAAENISSQT